MTSVSDIRSGFLSFFEKNGHAVRPSAPLVPDNDPTLLFVNAGMVPFKNIFTGVQKPFAPRAATSQKCVRAGGKHNDLDNVGYTARHHTFFEMLGNFSFGDYFKEQAIKYAWDMVTGEFGLSKDKLLVTVYAEDDEAHALWKKVAGLSDDKIIRIATSDNFWSMGDSGPCGPCSEIFYDHGDHIWGGPPGSPEEDGDRFIEIWNLVFMQFNQHGDGTRENLPTPSIDTGMGLERISTILQGVHNNYDIDLFKSLIAAEEEVYKRKATGDELASFRVIADHLRSSAFLLADGVLPSNEGRGYVLRRIMRRAMRHSHILGAQEPKMHELTGALLNEMGEAYPELVRAEALIRNQLEQEEGRFQRTLGRGLALLDDATTGMNEGDSLPGETAFKLYDTYGFPLDLTQDALREKGREVDTDGFDAAMAEQKAKARAAHVGSGDVAEDAIWFDIAEDNGSSEFLGYDTETAEGQVQAVLKDGALVDALAEGEEGWLVMNQTPFYAESGGQVADHGVVARLENRDELGHVTDVQKFADSKLIAHKVKVARGTISKGDPVAMDVDHARRTAIRANHSATHLLHEALREALGDHVAQRGSLNADDRLRFDFSHNKALSAEELTQVGLDVNAYIRQNTAVETRIMTPDDAREMGAQALFGEKYGDEVRVVSMGRANTGKGLNGDTYSLELCGGTHVKQTGDIGVFVLLSDSASSAGVRRIEALTGEVAFAHLEREAKRVAEVAGTLKAQPADIVDRVKALLDERKALQNEVATLRRELAMSGGSGQGAGPEAKEINGVKFFAQVLSGVSGKDLPPLIDEHKARLESGAVLLIADTDGKVAVAAGVTDDLKGDLSAVDLVRAAVGALGGKGGGGRPDMAQGGAKDASKADEAFVAAEAVIAG